MDSFYEQLHGRTVTGAMEHGRHAAVACDANAISDDYYEELSLELLPS
jgi:hypothetical protein